MAVFVTLPDPASEATTTYSTSMALAPTWKRFAVLPAQLASLASAVPPRQALQRTRYLQFTVHDDAEIWLDDLRWYGRALP